MEEVTANKKKMKELEDNLLFRLTSTQVEELTIFFVFLLLLSRHSFIPLPVVS